MPPVVDMRKVLEVLRYSQPRYRRVKLSAPPGKIWLLKSGRPGDFGQRCDRAVKRALELKLGFVDEELRELRPTADGLLLLAEKGWRDV